jgi:salicylate hydroxylase
MARAKMAIEDAAALASCLSTDLSTADALRRYEALRKPRTSKIQRVSRLNARVFHLRGHSANLRDRLLPFVTRRTRLADELYAYDALSVGAPGVT